MDLQDNAPTCVERHEPHQASSLADKVRASARSRLVVAWARRSVVLLAWALGVWGVSMTWSASMAWHTESIALGSVLVGMLTANILFARQRVSVPDLISDDLSLLEQCFAILQKQVAMTIRTSEAAVLIADVSRQTRLLLINASLGQVRAGAEGAGFKVVAAEVRRLSASQLESDAAAEQFTELARHVGEIGERLSAVLPYLTDLSKAMDDGMREVTGDIIDALGHMQFQDVNRQVLAQVETALCSLSDHSAALCKLVGGKAPPPPQKLEELMTRRTRNDVTHSQRVVHAQVERSKLDKPDQLLSKGRAPALELAESQGHKIELF